MTRGELAESVHRAVACAVDARGKLVTAYGNPELLVFARSAAKPFIAAAVVQSGAADRFGLDARELATIAASHNGETAHVSAVRSILAKAGLAEHDLQCGAHAPSYEPAAAELAAAGEPFTSLHNNCSGKHAGILAMCRALGAGVQGYLEPDHPVQQRILAFCARMVGAAPESLPLGVDGCGIPVFAAPLRGLALAFARFATLEEMPDADLAALLRVRDAMRAEAFYVAGTGRLDTALIEATAGRIVCKAGAEGVHGDALLESGLGLACKVLDGSRRAAAPAVIGCLEDLGALGAHERERLAGFAASSVRNVAGRIVGRIALVPARTASRVDTIASTA